MKRARQAQNLEEERLVDCIREYHTQAKIDSKYDSEATCNETSATLGAECLDINTNNDCKDWLKLINTAKKMEHLSERIKGDNVKDDNSSSFLLHEHLCSVLC